MATASLSDLNASHLQFSSGNSKLKRERFALHPAVLRWLDRAGMTLSTLCALHCALQPLWLLALSMLGLSAVMTERGELMFLVASALLAAWGLFSGIQHHGQTHLWWSWSLAAVLIAASRLFHAFEMPLAVAGALMLAACHFQNRRALKRIQLN